MNFFRSFLSRPQLFRNLTPCRPIRTPYTKSFMLLSAIPIITLVAENNSFTPTNEHLSMAISHNNIAINGKFP